MNFEKLFYVVISSIVITAFISVLYIFPPVQVKENENSFIRKIYFVDHISAAHQKVIERFNAKYKGQIEVEAINLPFTKFSTNERKELLARYLRSKSGRIDIFSVDQIWVPRFAKWSVPLDKFISPTQKGKLLKYALESCYYKDSLVAIPLYIDIALMYYRKDILQKLTKYSDIQKKLKDSITWEDFVLLKNELGNKYPFFLFQADDFEGLICIFAEMMANLGKPILFNGKLQLNTAEARQCLQLLVDIVNKYGLSPKAVAQLKENPSYNYYVKNNGVFLRGWTAFLSKESRSLFSNNEIFNYLESVPTPHFRGTNPVSVYGGWNLMISKFSSKIPESLKFLNFLISEEAQKILYEEGRLLPINVNVYKDLGFTNKDEELKFYYSLLQRGIHRPFTERYTAISDILSYYLNLAIRNEISVNEALAKAEEKINSNSILIK